MKPSKLHVLIVEDDAFQRRIMTEILRALDINSISEAENGKQALDIIRDPPSTPINIAICDLNMPEMDGMEFLRHLGEENLDVAVILTSALDKKLLASVGRMTALYGIDLLGTIEKPVSLKKLETFLAKYEENPTKPDHENFEQASYSLDDILDAVEKDQIEPFFQPKVDLKTGRLVGAEALARWIHPEKGAISPGAFIPALEKTGNIDKLTFRILEKSAASCKEFHAFGHALIISVNLSLASLADTSLADRMTEIVHTSGLAPHDIMFEITESAAMTNVAQALENLARLFMNGFSLSIDDYGTGSSNLQQLTRIAFRELKIDQSFVKDFSENDALKIVVKSSIDMAHKLNVKSVAEGVETRQDWDTLGKLGCDTVQGYLVGKPMDKDSFAKFISNYTPLSFLKKPKD